MKNNRRSIGFRGHRSATLALALAVCASSACSAGDNRPPPEAEQSLGSVHLALQTGNSSVFRLQGAVFEIKDHLGASVITLSSDASVSELTADLPQGTYSVTLADGWTLERAGDADTFTPVQAALVTANPREFLVKHGRPTQLTYAFATDTGLVTLGQGSLSLAVAVVDPGTLTPCQVMVPGSCASGLTCLLSGETGAGFCAQPGALPVGAACSSEQCGAGAQCLRASGEATGVCKRFCNPSDAHPICDCQSLSFDESIGVCSAPPACEPNCDVSTFTFTETAADDIGSSALFDFFSGLGSVSESDFMLFQVESDDGTGGAWCAQHADFYVNTYLDFSRSSGAVASGNWEKFSRPSGGSWSGSGTQQFTNFYGFSCRNRPFDWCSEWGLGGRFLAISPANTSFGESLQGSDFSPAGTVLKISIGADRAAVCGF